MPWIAGGIKKVVQSKGFSFGVALSRQSCFLPCHRASGLEAGEIAQRRMFR
jgi:hypothetical protein